jgi:hypothetical protein
MILGDKPLISEVVLSQKRQVRLIIRSSSTSTYACMVEVEMWHVLELAGRRCGPSWSARHDNGGVAALQVSAELDSLGWLVEACHCYRWSFSHLGGMRCWCHVHEARAVGVVAHGPCGWQGPDPCAQRSAKLQLTITLVDDDDRDVGACVVGRYADPCEVVATTVR